MQKQHTWQRRYLILGSVVAGALGLSASWHEGVQGAPHLGLAPDPVELPGAMTGSAAAIQSDGMMVSEPDVPEDNGIGRETGACCVADGSCEELEQADCETQGGTFSGNGVTCAPNCCPQLATGADCACDYHQCHDGAEFTGQVCDPADPDCPGDETCALICSGPILFQFDPVAVGDPEEVVTFTGSTSAASFSGGDGDDCTLWSGDPGWYEGFVLNGAGFDECWLVTVDFCCNDPIKAPVWGVLRDGCPCSPNVNPINPDVNLDGKREGYGIYGSAAHCCEDGNYAATYTLGPGAYTWQIYADAGNLGPYVGHFTVEPCTPAACCVLSWCTIRDKLNCEGAGGEWLGPGAVSQPTNTCAFNPCVTGSCCLFSEGCNDDPNHESQYKCTIQAHGYYHGGVTCDDHPCPGACCLPDGGCESRDKSACMALDGYYVGGGTSCDELACAVPNICGSRECDGDPPPRSKNDSPIYLFSGEKVEQVEDLRIPGRGLDFVLTRTYRSQAEVETAQGYNWGMSYDIWFEDVWDLPYHRWVLHMGDLRRDEFRFNELRGWYERPEYFAIATEEADGTILMRHDDGTNWLFAPLDDSPGSGKIITITDRNGNAMLFEYDPVTGRLTTIYDTLNRPITFAYTDDGLIESLTDFTGRQVLYEYYEDGDANGSFGDLKCATLPAVLGTPNSNDFPNGKTTLYKYSVALGRPYLNHNLLSITDGKGQEYELISYDMDEFSADADKVIREQFGIAVIDYVYVPVTPTAANSFAAIVAITNDRTGNVEHHYFDEGNRRVIIRDYTGRADSSQRTTLTENRPTNRLRALDPDYFAVRRVWDVNAQVSYWEFQTGESIRGTLDFDNPDPRARGNLLERRIQPGPQNPDQSFITEVFNYLPTFGDDRGGGAEFVTRHVDARGNVTTHDYDPVTGDRIKTTHRLVTKGVLGGGEQVIEELWVYNESGQVQQYESPRGRIGTITYHDSGPMEGYLECATIDADHLALSTCYEYDVVGNVTRITDPRGHDTQYVVNQLNQVVREISREVADGSALRYQEDTFYDANNNVVRVDIQNIDETGNLRPNTHLSTVFEYDLLDNVTRQCAESGSYTGSIPGSINWPICEGLPESEFVTTEYEYDATDNLTLVRRGEAVEGRQPHNLVRVLYDEREFVFQSIRAEGDPGQSTTQYDYDLKGNLVRVSAGLEETPRVYQGTYDCFDRLESIMDPEGNVVILDYDRNHNLVSVRAEGERIEGYSRANVRLSEAVYDYDEMDRRIVTRVKVFDGDGVDIGDGESVARHYYDADSNVIRIEDDNGHVADTAYDTAGRESIVTDDLSNTVAYTYDGNSNVTAITEIEKSDLGHDDQLFNTTYEYDNLDRLTRVIDNIGNNRSYGYDSRDNRTVLIDALNHETRYAYDGLNRLVAVAHDLDGDGADGNGADIVSVQCWDDTSRLRALTDDNGNTTEYEYDALDRPIDTVYADGTEESRIYDVHGNQVTWIDANGTVVTSTYDLLDRVVGNVIEPAEGVSDATTFASYAYDGLSRLVYAEDDDAIVERVYDSLDNTIAETLTIAIGGALTNGTRTAQYDGVGNRISCAYPGGRTVESIYDGLDRLQTVFDAAGIIAAYDHVGPGRVERRECGNSTHTEYEYDGISGVPNPGGDFGIKQIVRTKHAKIVGGAVIDERTYTWSRTGNKKVRKDERAGGPQLTHEYAYDAVSRLTQTTVSDPLPVLVGQTDYLLDGAGNRAAVTGDECSGDYTCDPTLPEPADRQTNQYTITPFDSRGYDLNGNLIHLGLPPVEPPAVASPPHDWRKNRILSFLPHNEGMEVAFQVELIESLQFPGSEGTTWWVTAPVCLDTDANPVDPPCLGENIWVSRLDPDPQPPCHWPQDVIHIGDCEVVPIATYALRATYGPQDPEVLFSDDLLVGTTLKPGSKIWGDCVGGWDGQQWTPPDQAVTMDDVMSAVMYFTGHPNKPHRTWVELDDEGLNFVHNFGDIQQVQVGFTGGDYSFSAPAACPVGAARSTAERAPLPEPPSCPRRTAEILYDYHNQMVEFTDLSTGQVHRYAYDPLGRRIARIVDVNGIAGGPTETRYFYDDWRVLEEQDELGNTQATYVFGDYIDEVLTMQRDVDGNGTPEDYYYHTDDLFNGVAVTDSAGDVLERYTYGDYGQPTFLDADDVPLAEGRSQIGNPYLFTGRRFDLETGLYHFRTRYLNPIAGRFTTRDIIGIWGDPLELGNGYTYVGNGPWTFVDPLGLGLGAWIITGSWNPPPGVYEEALDEFAESNSDRTQGTGDAIAENITGGIVSSVGGSTFDPANRAGAKATAGTILEVTEKAGGLTGIAKSVVRKGVGRGVRTTVGALDDAAKKRAIRAARERAIREFWRREGERLRRGEKGSREWTPRQRRDILDGKRPKDKHGRTIEGHHPAPVAQYPERAGDPDNVVPKTFPEHRGKGTGIHSRKRDQPEL